MTTTVNGHVPEPSAPVHGPVWEEEPTSERPIIAAVIYLLGAIALVGLVGVFVLIALKRDASSIAALTALVGPAIGGLASILATTRTSTPARNRKGVQAGLLQSPHSKS
jgi:hypothetical protein